MATAAEHYRWAEDLLGEITQPDGSVVFGEGGEAYVAAAQVASAPTVTKPQLSPQQLADVRLLKRSPRAKQSRELGRVCGGGVPQPGWPVCLSAGIWVVQKPWGTAYTHAYCATHAAARLRADDWAHTIALMNGGGAP